jgi:hypothetical protein
MWTELKHGRTTNNTGQREYKVYNYKQLKHFDPQIGPKTVYSTMLM